MRQTLAISLLILSVIILSPVAQAVPVFGTFQGSVSGSYDLNGGVFGTAGLNQEVGQTISGSFSYDTDWSNMSLSLGGTNLSVVPASHPPLYSFATVNGDDLAMVEGFASLFGGAAYISVFSLFDLPSSLLASGFDGSWSASQDPGSITGSWSSLLVSDFNVVNMARLDFELTGLTVSTQQASASVPEPGSLMLIAIGLLSMGGVWMTSRRRQMRGQRMAMHA